MGVNESLKQLEQHFLFVNQKLPYNIEAPLSIVQTLR
jgi:hypothetical protein